MSRGAEAREQAQTERLVRTAERAAALMGATGDWRATFDEIQAGA